MVELCEVSHSSLGGLSAASVHKVPYGLSSSTADMGGDTAGGALCIEDNCITDKSSLLCKRQQDDKGLIGGNRFEELRLTPRTDDSRCG